MIMPTMPIGGSLQNYLKTTKLNMKWEQRQNEMIEKMRKQDPMIADLLKDMQNMQKGNAIGSIDAKLKSGKKLSPEELDYLREHSPELYKQAIEIQREREAYERDLKKCKTKEDVDRLHLQKTQSFMQEIKAIKGNPNIPQGQKVGLMEKVMRRAMAISDSHATFINSQEYQSLPSELEEDAEKKKAQKKKAAEQEQEDMKIADKKDDKPVVSEDTDSAENLQTPETEAPTAKDENAKKITKTELSQQTTISQQSTNSSPPPQSPVSNYTPPQPTKSTIFIKV